MKPEELIGCTIIGAEPIAVRVPPDGEIAGFILYVKNGDSAYMVVESVWDEGFILSKAKPKNPHFVTR